MPDTLAYGAFHTLLAIRQCGADTKRVIHIVAIVVNVAVIAVDERRIVIVVTLRAEPPATLQPCPCHKETHTDFCYNHRFSISILCIICCFILVFRCVGQYIAAHHLLPELPCMSMSQMPAVACNTSRDILQALISNTILFLILLQAPLPPPFIRCTESPDYLPGVSQIEPEAQKIHTFRNRHDLCFLLFCSYHFTLILSHCP